MTPYHKKLLVLTSLKTHNLIFGEEAPSTTLEVLLCKTSIVYTVEFLHRVAEVLEHTTHYTVAARVNLNTHGALIL